jgi:hypothetical protein
VIAPHRIQCYANFACHSFVRPPERVARTALRGATIAAPPSKATQETRVRLQASDVPFGRAVRCAITSMLTKKPTETAVGVKALRPNQWALRRGKRRRGPRRLEILSAEKGLRRGPRGVQRSLAIASSRPCFSLSGQWWSRPARAAAAP